MEQDRRRLASTIGWDAPLAAVAGRRATAIEKAFGYRCVGELLGHYPRRWVPQDKLSDVAEHEVGDHVTVLARVRAADSKPYRDRRTGRTAHRLEVRLDTAGAPLSLAFFDQAKHRAVWRASQVRPGASGLFSGRLGRFRDSWQLTNPQTLMFGLGEDQEAKADAVFASLPLLVPIYPATAALQSWQIGEAIRVALDLVHEVPELLPEDVRARHGLVSARTALEGVHRADTWAQVETGRRRLVFDEALVLQTVLARRRAELRAVGTRARTGCPGGLLDRFDARLPFRLTAGQQEVGAEVLHDLGRGHPMHRLLQGEVGSGKTVVALRAMLRVVDSGGQAALLAPTEVLAQQHHRSLLALLGDLGVAGTLAAAEGATAVALLTGSQGTAARRAALLEAASGAAGIVVGTHALLEDTVGFADLGLVVVDEQHRFGVEQRAALSAKGSQDPPHVLVMTATPIPRTVAMTVFGDLEVSTLRELPAGRVGVQTNVVPATERASWLDRAFERAREEVAAGHQVYVVCPRIDPGDQEPPSAGEAPPAPTAAVEQVAPLLRDGAMRGLRVETLHGRMSPDRKEQVMRGFAAGAVDVLVATTVVEVGVDVANATMMLVLDADRFGVSQLHQLRGRIGRGGLPGLCLLVTSTPADSPARSRLEAVAATADGFELARVDLELRREGDVLGATQSGRRSSLRLLRVLDHEDVLVEARDVATRVVHDDPDLSTVPELADQVRDLEQARRADYLEKA